MIPKVLWLKRLITSILFVHLGPSTFQMMYNIKEYELSTCTRIESSHNHGLFKAKYIHWFWPHEHCDNRCKLFPFRPRYGNLQYKTNDLVTLALIWGRVQSNISIEEKPIFCLRLENKSVYCYVTAITSMFTDYDHSLWPLTFYRALGYLQELKVAFLIVGESFMQYSIRMRGLVSN